MMSKQVTVLPRAAYGVERYYPACDASQKLAHLAGCKSFTMAGLKAIKGLGYAVVIDRGGRETL